MSITLAWHWWFWPISVVLAGLFSAHCEAKLSQPGMFPDIGPALIVIASVIIAITLIIGHYL